MTSPCWNGSICFFWMDPSAGTACRWGQLYNILEQDIAANMDGGKRIVDNVTLKDGSITEYTLATDNGGNAVRSQAVAYMESVLGIQGVRSLTQKVQGQEETIQVIEAKKDVIDEEQALAQYETMKEQAREQTVPSESLEAELPFRKILSTRWMPYRRRRERAYCHWFFPQGRSCPHSAAVRLIWYPAGHWSREWGFQPMILPVIPGQRI